MASPGTGIPVSEETSQRFDAVLEAFAQQEKVTIVAEGVPLHLFGGQTPLDDPDTIPTNAPDIFLSEVREGGRNIARDAVALRFKSVGRSYDYELARIGGVLALRKCYSDPSDLPDVSPEEAQRFLKRAVALVTTLSSNSLTDGDSLDKFAVQFVRGLSEEQLSHLKQLHLSLADLNPDQQEQAKRFALFFHVYDPLRSLKTSFTESNQCIQPHSFLLWRTDYERNKSTIGINCPLGWSGSGPASFVALNAEDSTAPQSKKVVAEREQSLQKTVTLRGVTTLGELAAETKRLTQGAVSVVIDPALAPKRVCLYGAAFATPEEVLRAAAAVYSLRLVKRANGSRDLIGPPVPGVERLGDLRDALAAIVPHDYRRALHIDAKDARAAVAFQLREEGRYDYSGTFNPQTYSDYMDDIKTRPQNMRLEGIRRLLSADSKRPNALEARTPLTALTPDEKNSITAILLKPALEEIAMLTLAYQQPPFFSDWNRLTLGGNIDQDEKGKTLYHLFLSAPTRGQPGKMHTTNGLVVPGE